MPAEYALNFSKLKKDNRTTSTNFQGIQRINLLFSWYTLSKYFQLISTMNLDGRKDILSVMPKSILYTPFEQK